MAKKNVATKPQLVQAPQSLRLDLGAGQSPREGFRGVDLNAPNPEERVDLFKFPWPWKDSSVDELHASHFVEHIPARDIEERDLSIAGPNDLAKVGKAAGLAGVSATLANWSSARDKFVGQDMFFAFFDECWRILKPGCDMTVIWPALRSNRAFQDPTHRRFIPAESVFYLSREWRTANKLDHYRVLCNFQGNVNFSMTHDESLNNPEAQQRRFNLYWNTMIDFHAVMKAVK